MTVCRGRAPEELRSAAGGFGVARAVAPLDRLVMTARPLLRAGGTLLALKGRACAGGDGYSAPSEPTGAAGPGGGRRSRTRRRLLSVSAPPDLPQTGYHCEERMMSVGLGWPTGPDGGTDRCWAGPPQLPPPRVVTRWPFHVKPGRGTWSPRRTTTLGWFHVKPTRRPSSTRLPPRGRFAAASRGADRPVAAAAAASRPRRREPEGWRRQDHQHGQPGGGPGAARPSGAGRRP